MVGNFSVVFSTDCSKDVGRYLFVLCGALLLPKAGCPSCFVMFLVLLLCLSGPVWHCVHHFGEEETGCFTL